MNGIEGYACCVEYGCYGSFGLLLSLPLLCGSERVIWSLDTPQRNLWTWNALLVVALLTDVTRAVLVRVSLRFRQPNGAELANLLACGVLPRSRTLLDTRSICTERCTARRSIIQ